MKGVFLHEAFRVAKVDQTTYSRSRRGITSMRWVTAVKVSAALDKIHLDRTAVPKTAKKARKFRVVSG